ncbi:Histone deacetylase complex subunit CTI6 [Mycena indigotica]|uniref:Histone deacetylase complex subunit CTI6 n=1 Tax=Mycena indigotica TaxID=2126181 RepID=A0A8H6WFA4_9AGAR|nr:Histone deacetylase complex subunit CTI6 [Mycena indigotica]KAF7315617.1 Histone deacetylase complex subunit CTI6 [Mycena indigotica]
MSPPSPTSRRRSKPFPSPPVMSKSPDSDRPPPRGKRMKQEDIDPTVDTQDPSIVSSTSSTSNGRASTSSTLKAPKRKTKEKNPPRSDPADDSVAQPEDEDNGGVTRCICGREDDPDAGEFMVQCETCKVWQHGLCMGYDSESQLHDDDYYCEQCRPELHTESLRKSRRRPRHSSANGQRQSRSHSPSLLKQPSKRRNTMNSRDAAFDENIKEILETTAAEANAAGQEPTVELEADGPPNRKKRKRNEEEAPPKKRTRSASSASEQRVASVAPREESPPPPPPPKAANKSGARRRGGGRKIVDGEQAVPAPPKRGGARAKGSKRAAAPPVSVTNGHSASNNTAYRNSHAYAVSQQQMHTSWNLPDYLSHLEPILPSGVPQQPQVISGGPSASASRGESEERQEVLKVKWPSKRMSVGDMNKRVRALVEWVGREQASASERNKRRQALEAALQEELARDIAIRAENPDEDIPELVIPKCEDRQAIFAVKQMEGLMEDLIRFQEAY